MDGIKLSVSHKDTRPELIDNGCVTWFAHQWLHFFIILFCIGSLHFKMSYRSTIHRSSFFFPNMTQRTYKSEMIDSCITGLSALILTVTLEVPPPSPYFTFHDLSSWLIFPAWKTRWWIVLASCNGKWSNVSLEDSLIWTKIYPYVCLT